MSAQCAVARDTWRGPHAGDTDAIAVYYHPTHAFNVERMLRASKLALAYYTANWIPYPLRQFRVVEFPRYDSDFRWRWLHRHVECDHQRTQASRLHANHSRQQLHPGR